MTLPVVLPNQFLTHITKDGERWDQIAYQYYADALVYELVITANPQVAITTTLPAGLVLSIPMIATAQAADDLPPWLL